jgi:hypothetical protein
MTIICASVTGTYKKIKNANKSRVFYFSDFFDPIVLSDLEEQFGKPDAVIGDVEGSVKDIGHPFYFIPALNMGLLRWIDKIKNYSLPGIIDNTNYCFCWSINRKHIDRYLVIRLIEFFGFEKFRYTWSGVDSRADCASLIVEMQEISAPWLTPELKAHILKPIQIGKSYSHPPDSHSVVSIVQLPYGGLEFVAQVQQQLSRECAVYVLTESMTDNNQHYTFSEKTLWCLLNACFPIWAGNYAQAEMAERIGIDVFSDVIDHSYQYKNTLLERCWYALHDNIKILSDLEFARELRDRHRDRLYQNQEWVRDFKVKKYLDMQRNELADIGVDLDPENFRFRVLP